MSYVLVTATEDTDLTSDMEDMSPATQKPRGTGLDILVRQSQKQTGNPGKMTGKQRPLSAKAGSSYASKKNALLLQTLFPKGSLSVKSTETTKKGVADRSPLQGVFSPAATRRQHKEVGKKRNRKSR
jgi:hypothetical protein